MLRRDKKREEAVDLHSFVEVYNILHSDHHYHQPPESNDEYCWMIKGVSYSQGQVDVYNYLCNNQHQHQHQHQQHQHPDNSSQQQPSSYPRNQNTTKTTPSCNSDAPAATSHPYLPQYRHPSQPSSSQPSYQPSSQLVVPQTFSSPSSPQRLMMVTTMKMMIFEWSAYDLSHFRFWGCQIPPEIASVMRSRGAEVIESPSFLPFQPFRRALYQQQELRAQDDKIYAFFLANESTLAPLDTLISSMMAIHDQSVKSALLKQVHKSGCKVVTILGGHDVKRASEQYRQVVSLTYALVQQGFMVVSGGGPGAMEAANLGAYMHNRTWEEVERALHILTSTRVNMRLPFEYLSTAPAEQVIHHFGPPSSDRSIGIPTWRYGREPSNLFAGWHAKLFSSALRLDALVAVATGGIIFTPGGAGTREEIFYATREHHFFPHKQAPIVFYGHEFWHANGVYPLSKKLSLGRDYHENIVCTDSIPDIVTSLCNYKNKRQK